MDREFNRTEWELSERRNNYSVIKNRTTGKSCEEYVLNNITEEDKNLWTRRYKIQDQNVLTVIGCEIFCGLNSALQFNQYNMRVYLDSTMQRFSQLRSVTIADEQEFILPVLKGFDALCQIYGAFRVHPSMVGLTLEKESKVWISPNFLENKVLEQDRVSQTEMVNSILRIFKRLYTAFPQNRRFKETLQVAADIKSHYIPRRKPISDLLSVINKTEFDPRNSYQAQPVTKHCFSKKEKNDLNISVRDTIKVPNTSTLDADPNRKTAKNVNNLSHIFSPPKVSDVRHDLFGSLKTHQEKLTLIQQVLSIDKESGNARLCLLYRHSFLNDKQMFSQLERVKGKLVNIADIKILLKISEVVSSESSRAVNTTNFKKPRNPRISLADMDKIKREITGDPLYSGPPTMTKEQRIEQAKCMKDQAHKLLFD